MSLLEVRLESLSDARENLLWERDYNIRALTKLEKSVWSRIWFIQDWVFDLMEEIAQAQIHLNVMLGLLDREIAEVKKEMQ